MLDAYLEPDGGVFTSLHKNWANIILSGILPVGSVEQHLFVAACVLSWV